ncbi:hypothetical protein BB497_03375 [Halomonas sp. GFAJ-1]|nr:hypothetical protein BB497_03375 [Halomonas sp. GFAJ-1]
MILSLAAWLANLLINRTSIALGNLLMNIQLLLSANQGQSALSSAPAQMLGSKGTPQALFQQALTQASGAQLQRLTSSPTEASSSDPLASFAQLLTSLDIELDEDALADLLTRLQAVDLNSAHPMVNESSLSEASALTPLDEIAARLSLVAAFSEAPVAPELQSAPQVRDIAQQLAVSESQAAELLTAFNSLSDATPQGTTLTELHRQVANLLPSANTTEGSQSLTAYRSSNIALPVDINASSLRMGGDAPNIATALAELTPSTGRGAESPISTQPSILTPATGSLMTSASIGTPVSSPAWPSQLGQQLIQLAQRGGEHQVKMQLHPAELGPLSISLKVSEHGTQAHFLSAHAQVRQALELAIPQLREALAEQGISLGETSVGEHNNPNEQAFAQQGSNTPNSSGDSGSKEEGDSAIKLLEGGNPLVLDGRVDLYA